MPHRKVEKENKRPKDKIIDRIRHLLSGSRQKKEKRPPIQSEALPVSGKTEKLSRSSGPDVQADQEIVFTISKNGKEEKQLMIEDRFIVGRNKIGVHYTDHSEGVSRIHCEIVRGQNGLEVKDLGSLNGTSVNGEQLVPYKAYPFKPGDVLKYVQTEIRLADERRFSQLA